MIVKEMGSFVVLGMVVVAGIIGVASKYLTKENDGPVEELTEEFIEDQIEKMFDLPMDSIDIDLTPEFEE